MNNETEQIFLVSTSSSQPPAEEAKINQASASTTDVDDFSTVCRTCATVTEFVIPIFDGEGVQNNLAEKIAKHLPIQVSEQDVLPRVVCYQCASTLLAWHELVQCCVQADAALRARLAHCPAHRQKSKPDTSKEIIPNSSGEKQEKFKDIEDFVVQTLEPPKYTPPAIKSCVYCLSEVPEQFFKEHLVTLHSDYLFHCDECDTYVDRKEFLLHMSLHAVEYATKQEKKELEKKTKKVAKKRTDLKDENENGERVVARKCYKRSGRSVNRGETDKSQTVKKSGNTKFAQENEFSDHSDTDGFGPLPESVFEAIEDSQESQPAEAISPTIEAEDSSSRAENPAPPPDPPKEATAKKIRTCQICGKAYTASSSYFYHMKHFHGRSREHECPTCGKGFATRAALAQHEPVHTGACAYGCDRCGKRFRSRASLYIHSQTHGGEKRWVCSECGRGFRWRAQLARHTLRHAAAKAFTCADCPRAFSVKADLLRHARTHTRQHHACPHCGDDFAQLRYLKVHLHRKHPTAPEPAAEVKTAS